MPKRQSPAKTMGLFPPSVHDDWEVSSYVNGQTLPAAWSPDAYAQWFFDFLRTDLKTLTPGQLLGMRADVWAFVRPEIIEDKSWGDEYLPPAETLEALQRDARAGIQRVLEGQWYGLERGIRYGIARAGEHLVRGSRRGTFEDLFRVAVMDTVQAFWDRLHECPRCHAIFLKIGKRKYCSPTCASGAHWDAFKARRGDRDHHLEYARRAKKRLGPNVKIKRRRQQ